MMPLASSNASSNERSFPGMTSSTACSRTIPSSWPPQRLASTVPGSRCVVRRPFLRLAGPVRIGIGEVPPVLEAPPGLTIAGRGERAHHGQAA